MPKILVRRKIIFGRGCCGKRWASTVSRVLWELCRLSNSNKIASLAGVKVGFVPVTAWRLMDVACLAASKGRAVSGGGSDNYSVKQALSKRAAPRPRPVAWNLEALALCHGPTEGSSRGGRFSARPLRNFCLPVIPPKYCLQFFGEPAKRLTTRISGSQDFHVTATLTMRHR